jgi:hypothetical protein
LAILASRRTKASDCWKAKKRLAMRFAIQAQLYIALQRLNAGPELLAVVGS